MKKIFSVMVVAIVALCSIVLTSCNSNKSNSASEGENKYTEAPLIDDFVLLSTVNDDGKLIKLKQSRNVSQAWFNLINPSGEEIEHVSSMLKVDPDILKNSLDADERSRTEVDDGIFSAIINLPLLDEEGNFDTLPCGLVFSAKNFLTICSKDNRILGAFNKNTAKTFDTRERTRFMLLILYKITQFYLRYLAIINRKTEHIEDALKQTTNNQELFQLIDRKSVV